MTTETIRPDGGTRPHMNYPHGGYEWLAMLERVKWRPVASWGRDGFDLGSWPLVCVGHGYAPTNHPDEPYGLAYYVEGDVWVTWHPTREDRDAATDELALFHWRNDPLLADLVPAEGDHVPARFRGPFTWDRLERDEPDEDGDA